MEFQGKRDYKSRHSPNMGKTLMWNDGQNVEKNSSEQSSVSEIKVTILEP